MARDIIFRGKRRNDGEWIYGFFCQWQNDCYICPTPHESGFHGGQPMRFELDGWFVVDPATVGQFTGLHDKNGKEIYEGDRVRFHPAFGLTTTGIMAWHNSAMRWCFVDRLPAESAPVHFHIDPGYMLEVVGNIDDNPQLAGEYK